MTEGTETTGRSGMAGLLARRLLDAGRGADEPFTVAELRRSLLPYPRCRTDLGLASKAEYDVDLLRLLHRDGLLESDDPELDEEVERELSSPEPALGVLDDHAAAALRPGPRLRRRLREGAPAQEEADAEPPGSDAGAGGRAPPPGEAGGEGTDPPGDPSRSPDDGGPAGPSGPSGRDAAGDDGAAPVVSGSSAATPAAGACPACRGELPDADGVRFCPHCGEVLEARPCRECGEEMAAGWRFCPFCGSEHHE